MLKQALFLLFIASAIGVAKPFALDFDEFDSMVTFYSACLAKFDAQSILEVANLEIEDDKKVDESWFYSASPQDFLNLVGQRVSYRIDGYAHAPQILRRLSDLPADDQRLVKNILVHSKKPRYINAEERDRDLAQMFTEANRTAPLFQGLNDDEVRETIRRVMGTDAIEYGAWKIETKSRKAVVAPFTSRMHQGMDNYHSVSALNGAAKAHAIETSDIARLKFFHNHPGSDRQSLLLTAGDENVAVVTLDALRKHTNVRIPHSVYSIYQGQSGIILVSELVLK